ncbi:hypothetical protein EMIT0P260_190064 [Pseudomonas sp. IT-P260]
MFSKVGSDMSLRSLLFSHFQGTTRSPVGAAEGCDLLILKGKIKRSSDRGPSLRQLLQGFMGIGLLGLELRPK